MPKRRANGEGSIYPQTKDKNGKTTLWAAQYTDYTGKTRTLYGKTQTIVKDKLKNAINQSDKGMPVGAQKITFAKWMTDWLENYAKPTIKENTYGRYYNFIHGHLIPYFPKILLRDLQTDALQIFYNKKAKTDRKHNASNYISNDEIRKNSGLSVSTLNLMNSLVITALNQAIKNKYIFENVAKDVKLPKKNTDEKQILSLEEQKKLESVLLNSDRPIAFAIYLNLYTGLRIGELLALKIKDVDLEKKELYVRRTVARIYRPEEHSTEFVVGTPKTPKSIRIVPLPDFIVEKLTSFIEASKVRREIINAMNYKFRKQDFSSWKQEDYLFTTYNGKPYDASNVRKIFNGFLKEAGVKKINFHCLRHTFATRAVEIGFDIKSLSDILGHTDAKMTLNIYSHALSEQKRNNMEKLASIYHSTQ